MNVRDAMSAALVTIPPDMKVADVARTMLSTGAVELPVVDAQGRVLGVVTQTDLVTKHARVHFPRYLGILGGIVALNTHRAEEDLRHVLGVTARDLMTDDAASVAPDTDIDDAATLMVDEGVGALLVMENGCLVGMLTRADIIRLLILEEADEGTQAGG